MAEYIWNLIVSALKYLAGWFLDILVWVFEWLYGLVSGFLQWLYELVGGVLVTALEAMADVMPSGVVETVLEAYEWLEYINAWIPIKYGLALLAAYFALTALMAVVRWVMRIIPGLGG